MKKIILGIAIFSVFVLSSKASSIFIGAEGTNYNYETTYIGGRKAFLLNGEFKDIKTVNNLAYIANLKNDLIFEATIQMLIWESINPDIDYYVSDGINEIDVSNYLIEIDNYLKEYNITPTIAAETYDIYLEEELNIDTLNYDLRGYNIDRNGTIYSNYIKVDYTASNVINFNTKDLNVLNNYVYANYIYYQDFVINLNLIANQINIYNNTNDLIIYEVFDELDNFMYEVTLNKGLNTIYFKKGTDIYLQNKEDRLYFEDSNEIYEITIGNKYNVLINTLSNTNVSVYKDNELIENINCDKTCNIILEEGTYEFINNLTNYKIKLNIIKDTTINLDEEEIIKEEVKVDIPDTNINYNIERNYLIAKKRYYIIKFNNHYYINN